MPSKPSSSESRPASGSGRKEGADDGRSGFGPGGDNPLDLHPDARASAGADPGRSGPGLERAAADFVDLDPRRLERDAFADLFRSAGPESGPGTLRSAVPAVGSPGAPRSARRSGQHDGGEPEILPRRAL